MIKALTLSALVTLGSGMAVRSVADTPPAPAYLASETLSRQSMVLEVSVAGQSGEATIDTGATLAVVDAALVPHIDPNGIDQSVSVIGIGGRRDYKMVDLPSLVVGGIEIGPLRAALNTSKRFPGPKTVIPTRAFAGRTVDIDFRSGALKTYDTDPARVRRAFTCRMPYDEIAGLPFVDISLNGRQAKALIDTGAEVSLINPALAMAARTRLVEGVTRRLFGADLQPGMASVRRARKMFVGRHQFEDFLIVSTPSSFFEEVGLGDQPVMIMGRDMLKNFRIQIDRAKGTVNFVRPLRPGEPSPILTGYPRVVGLRSKCF
ncbi:MAG: aspartyl protease family protein [Pseudomonadota bacterium]